MNPRTLSNSFFKVSKRLRHKLSGVRVGRYRSTQLGFLPLKNIHIQPLPPERQYRRGKQPLLLSWVVNNIYSLPIL